MTSRSAFTNDEWDLVTLTPVAVGLAVAKVGHSGLIGSVRETQAVLDTIGQADRTHAVNEVIQAVVADDRYPKNELVRAAIATALEHNLERAVDSLAGSSETLALAAVEDCAAVSILLDSRASPSEATDYRKWILEIAQRVAETATEGGVIVSPAEEDLISRIAAAFDADSDR